MLLLGFEKHNLSYESPRGSTHHVHGRIFHMEACPQPNKSPIVHSSNKESDMENLKNIPERWKLLGIFFGFSECICQGPPEIYDQELKKTSNQNLACLPFTYSLKKKHTA